MLLPYGRIQIACHNALPVGTECDALHHPSPYFTDGLTGDGIDERPSVGYAPAIRAERDAPSRDNFLADPMAGRRVPHSGAVTSREDPLPVRGEGNARGRTGCLRMSVPSSWASPIGTHLAGRSGQWVMRQIIVQPSSGRAKQSSSDDVNWPKKPPTCTNSVYSRSCGGTDMAGRATGR